MKRFLRYLRIAFSVTCGIACVLLIALWVRSYKEADILSGHISTSKAFSLTSDKGRLLLSLNTAAPNLRFPVPWHSTYVPGPVSGKLWTYGKLPAPSAGWYVKAPQGQFVLLVAPFAALPWVRWRFSLRTLLIVTTLFALLLGLVVYAIR